MLDVRGLHAFYGDSHVLHGISMRIPPGHRVAVLGRNGAGKSTLLKALLNAEPRCEGSVTWKDRALDGVSSFERARLGFGFVPEDRRILGCLTVIENIRLAWAGTPKERRTHDPDALLAQFPMLVPLRDKPGGLLSGGQQQLVALARAAITNPDLLLLDEPTEGLAPIIVEQLVNDVLDICKRSRGSLLLCEQNMWFSRQCTDYVYLLDSGQFVFEGTWDQLDDNEAVRLKHLAMG